MIAPLLLAAALAAGAAEPPRQGAIGAGLKEEGGRFVISLLLPEGPAARDGRLQPGDAIEAVAQAQHPWAETEGMLLEQVVALIRGRPGTVVRLRVYAPPAKGGKTVVRTVTLVREALNLTPGSAPPGPQAPASEIPPPQPQPAPLTPEQKKAVEDQL